MLAYYGWIDCFFIRPKHTQYMATRLFDENIIAEVASKKRTSLISAFDCRRKELFVFVVDTVRNIKRSKNLSNSSESRKPLQTTSC